MQVIELIVIALNLINLIQGQLQPYVVDGHDANILDFPYCARLKISCVDNSNDKGVYICGSSIVNQDLTLTAAHCLSGCSGTSNISIFVGRELKLGEATTTAHSFFIHDTFDEQTLANDISLVRLTTSLTFSAKVNRVALMADPPYNETAVVAGWGLLDEENKTFPKGLQYTEQHVKDKKKCEEQLNSGDLLKDGTFCASNNEGYAARGDSGSALVVRHYIQIGIVSYKLKHTTPSNKKIAIYTDTGYFYKWITKIAEQLMCIELSSSESDMARA